MDFLEEYDAAAAEGPARQGALLAQWLTTDRRAFYARLCRDRPVLVTPFGVFVTRFADVTEVLSRSEVFTVRAYAPMMDVVLDGPFILSRDGREHRAERGVAQAVLLPHDAQHVRELAGGFADAALDGLLERARARGEDRIDLVRDFARRVPLKICGAYLGFPGPDEESMTRWSQASQIAIFRNPRRDPEPNAAAAAAGKEMRAYLAGLIAERRASLQDRPEEVPQDVLGRLLRLCPPAELSFDDHRVAANLAGMLIGYLENTAQSVVQVIEQLMLRPGVRREAERAAADDPALFDRYVWEALRLNPFAAYVFRLCEETYTLASGTPRETVIPAGTVVMACHPAAMSDPAVVPEPDAFRIDRPAFAYLHFGHGVHDCVGGYAGAATITEMVRRVLLRPELQLLPPPDGAIGFDGTAFPTRFALAVGSSAGRRQEALT
ncbi:cytochrome P450 [Actinomadura scrupuli]|uniref:cytochrome P450 n=1 Tax=Actinomadura scrupuli TaxID=559629 RepID=UPI003D98D3F4